MKAKYIAILASILSFVACNIQEESLNDPSGVVSFHAVNGDVQDTKTVLESDGNLLWSAKDKIDIFVGAQSFEFTGTNTSAVSEATFIGSLDGVDWSSGKEYWAVYPHSANNSSDGSSMIVSLPAEQEACAGTFAKDLFISIAKSQDYDLSFFNVCGGIKFSVTEAGVKSVTFKGNNGEAIAGTAKVIFDQNGKPIVQEINNPLSEITLSAPAGTTLEVGKWYYIVCFPTVLENGYVMSVKKADGTIAKKIGDGSVSIKRAIWGRLKELDKNLSYADPYLNEPFTITSSGSTTVTIQKNGTPDDITLEYRTGSNEWASYTIGSGIDLADGESLQFRAGAGGNDGLGKSTSEYYYFSISGTGTIEVCGNIMSILDRDLLRTSMSSYGFIHLFKNCTNLVRANNLILPATTLAQYCYEDMFEGCKSLTTAPELPATTLALGCYQNMFSWCTSLTTAPELPATTLAEYCYQKMFSWCTSLTTAPELPATTLAEYCYQKMFDNCTSLTTAPELPATTLAEYCYSGMFYSCRGLASAPDLPATTLTRSCYSYMFYDCTSLTTGPELPATTLASSCYAYMFCVCKGLTSAPELPATTLVSGCYSYMFAGCSELTTAPGLPATTLESFCYSGMFKDCSKLNYIKMLATNISASYCLDDWVKDVAATGTFVKSSTASWNVTGASGVPAGWTVLTAITTPEVVDLGLSVKWATFDLGAEYEGDFGDAYSWGELEPWTESTTWQYYSYDKSPDVLPLSDDVANVKLGGNWRMPTEEETKELVANCTVTYETVNSVSCLKLTSKKNGQSIYLPRYRFYNNRVLPEQGDVSYFWTSSIYALYTDYAVFYGYDSNHTSNPIDHSNKYCGFAIRPVWSDNSSGSQLVSNEPVDLGLSVKWASCNLGANSPEEYGDYYAWGETEPKEDYSWSTYKWCNGSSTTLTKYNTNSSYGTVDNKTVLELEDDVAHVKLGGKWRMPTDAEWTELRTKCIWAWRTNYKGSGINGRLVEAPNGNRIFLPAAGYRYGTYLSDKADSNGYYWSSSLSTAIPYYAWYVNFPSDYVYWNSNYRYFGLFVRPVSE